MHTLWGWGVGWGEGVSGRQSAGLGEGPWLALAFIWQTRIRAIRWASLTLTKQTRPLSLRPPGPELSISIHILTRNLPSEFQARLFQANLMKGK